jgi:hypothetical protein
MKTKALILIGLHSKKWLAEKLGITTITLEKRLTEDYWKPGELALLEIIFNEESKISL